MIKREVTIVNKLGLHARAAAKFVNLASAFEAEIQLEKNERRVNGKSIMGIMMLAAARGNEVAIIAEGRDEAEAVAGLEELINDKFGEDA